MTKEDSQKPPKFEDALERLEELVEELESGNLALEETIAKFEEGQGLLRTCTELLGQAEQKVKAVLERSDGSLAAEDFTTEDGDE